MHMHVIKRYYIKFFGGGIYMLRIGSAEKKKAVIFGIGYNYHTYKANIQNIFDVVALIDNNWKKLGEDCQPISILDKIKYDVVLILPNDYADILLQLKEYGVAEDKIIVYMEDYRLRSIRTSLNLKCFAQHFDDLVLAAVFGQIGVEHPSYLDLGANLPYGFSNTALFYDAGCEGIVVEANPMLIPFYKKARPNDNVINIGISTEEGELPFYKVDNYSGLNTFSKAEVTKLEQLGYSFETISLPVITLHQLIEKYCPNGFPDFLDCDIEGLDYVVLESYDLENNGPKVIAVEVRENEIEKFDMMLNRKGYFRFCRIGENNIYVKNEYSTILCHYKI